MIIQGSQWFLQKIQYNLCIFFSQVEVFRHPQVGDSRTDGPPMSEPSPRRGLHQDDRTYNDGIMSESTDCTNRLSGKRGKWN